MRKQESHRELLKQLIAGERPVLHLSLISINDRETLIKGQDIVPNEQVQKYVEQVKKNNPLHQVLTTHVSKAEYEDMSNRLEEEY